MPKINYLPTAEYPVRTVKGDCYNVMGCLPDESVNLIVTDPPYNVVNRDSGGLREFDKGVADAAPINVTETAKEFVRIVRGSIYVWCSTEQVSEWRSAFVSLGLTTRQCVWIKTNPAPTNGEKMWLSGVELCVFARKPKAPFFRHCKVPAWTGASERVKGFACPKPVWLMKELVESSSSVGDVVMDPFAGSGTTLVAATQLKRLSLGIEKEQTHYDIIRQRVG